MAALSDVYLGFALSINTFDSNLNPLNDHDNFVKPISLSACNCTDTSYDAITHTNATAIITFDASETDNSSIISEG